MVDVIVLSEVSSSSNKYSWQAKFVIVGLFRNKEGVFIASKMLHQIGGKPFRQLETLFIPEND